MCSPTGCPLWLGLKERQSPCGAENPRTFCWWDVWMELLASSRCWMPPACTAPNSNTVTGKMVYWQYFFKTACVFLTHGFCQFVCSFHIVDNCVCDVYPPSGSDAHSLVLWRQTLRCGLHRWQATDRIQRALGKRSHRGHWCTQGKSVPQH